MNGMNLHEPKPSQQFMKQLKSIKEFGLISNTRETVYIAGKVTGLPYLDALTKFVKAEAQLVQAGYAVINPMYLVHKDTDWKQAMRICLSILPHADHIFLLHDWNESEGAMWERDTAERLGIPRLILIDKVALSTPTRVR